METPERILREFETIAVVGISRDPEKAAHSVPRALQKAGFRVLPVNPHAETLLDVPVFRTLADIDRAVDVVLVFRPSDEAADVARQAAAIGAKALWLQLGIRSEEARRIAESAGMLFVQDQCIAVERSLRGVVKRR
ncbi:MAG TPA: CoA-binding protein [Polyangiaceae bacterium]